MFNRKREEIKCYLCHYDSGLKIELTDQHKDYVTKSEGTDLKIPVRLKSKSRKLKVKYKPIIHYRDLFSNCNRLKIRLGLTFVYPRIRLQPLIWSF